MRTRQRWIPENGASMDHPKGLGVVYLYASQTPRRGLMLAAVAYSGNRAKCDAHLLMPDVEKAHEWIERYFENLTERAASVAERRTARNRPHTLKAGSIVYNSWGYDQTNIDFYEVTRVTSHYVWLRPLTAEVTETSPLSMCGRSVPMRDKAGKLVAADGTITKHAARTWEYGNSITFKHGAGSEWDGKPVACSWYA